MIPAIPAGYEDAARTAPAQAFELVALNIIGLIIFGVLGLWWKLHRIGMTFAQFKAELNQPPAPARIQPAGFIEITPNAAAWGAGVGLEPGTYRDDSSTARKCEAEG